MALVVYDRVQETTATTGTGTITLGGAVAGYQSFAVVGNGNTTFYCIVNGSAWEVGIGTYTSSGTTLARTTVLSNSNGNTSPITLSGSSNVFVTYPASKSINYDANDVATIGSTLGYSDTGIVGSFASTVAGYNQVIIQNKSNSSSASSNLNVSNDVSTSTTGYAELGINSSTFSGTGSFSIAGASYLASASTDLTIGTYGAYSLHFVTNSSTTDAMTIYNSGGVSLGGYADPGIGTLYANNIYLGFNAITAAAGTTVLTNASAGYQNVTGTTTQTIQLPVATTLYKGLAFTVANASTGNVTIKDSASTTIDTIITGGTAVLVLTNNGTSAGTWVAYSYIPASYDFSSTSASFGNATISSAVWNGTTIASGYGGTGLTTFSAANNALYSTSSSALAAGTLPVAAGGTGMTTATTNGVFYGNGTSAHGVTAAGTTGQVLIATTSGAPSWGSVPTTGAVTSLNFGTTGLTPASATTGAITVAGTLVAGNGGTGVATLTGLAYGNGTSAFTAATAAQVVSVIGTTAVANATLSANTSSISSAVGNNYTWTGINTFNNTRTTFGQSATGDSTLQVVSTTIAGLRIGYNSTSANYIDADNTNIRTGNGTNIGYFNSAGWNGAVVGNASTATTATNQSGGTVSATTGSFSSTVNFAGGSSVASNGDITARRSSGTSGVVYFGNGTPYIYYDGSNFNFNGGYINAAGTGLTGTASSLSIGGSATSATYLNSSNYINQTGSTGTWNSDFQNTPAGTARYNGDVGANTSSNPGGTWWIQQNFRHTNSSNYWGTQVAWGWEDNANRLATRNVTGGTFGSWVYYLNSSNYTSYAPSLTGSGASGTWGINVTGNANTVSHALGIGQTWTDVTSSRAVGTTYTNSTGYPILVMITMAGGGSTFNINIAGTTFAQPQVSNAGYSNELLSFIVQNSQTYAIATTGGGPVIVYWSELR